MLNAEFIALTQGFELDLAKTLEVIHGTTATNGQLKMNYTSKVFKPEYFIKMDDNRLTY